VTPGGLGNTLSINQDATLYHVKLVPGEAVQLEADARAGYLHGIAGSVQLEDLSVAAGDGVGIARLPSGLELVAGNAGFEGLWFDLPPM
jgi:quercetin 2,3-dioxygenase